MTEPQGDDPFPHPSDLYYCDSCDTFTRLLIEEVKVCPFCERPIRLVRSGSEVHLKDPPAPNPVPLPLPLPCSICGQPLGNAIRRDEDGNGDWNLSHVFCYAAREAFGKILSGGQDPRAIAKDFLTIYCW